MKIKVEQCWNGKENYQRLTFPCGGREFIMRDTWDRKTASEALDVACNFYGAKRKSVKFV